MHKLKDYVLGVILISVVLWSAFSYYLDTVLGLVFLVAPIAVGLLFYLIVHLVKKHFAKTFKPSIIWSGLVLGTAISSSALVGFLTLSPIEIDCRSITSIGAHPNIAPRGRGSTVSWTMKAGNTATATVQFKSKSPIGKMSVPVPSGIETIRSSTLGGDYDYRFDCSNGLSHDPMIRVPGGAPRRAKRLFFHPWF